MGVGSPSLVLVLGGGRRKIRATKSLKFPQKSTKVRSSFTSGSTEVFVFFSSWFDPLLLPRRGWWGHHVVGEPGYGERGGSWEEEEEAGMEVFDLFSEGGWGGVGSVQSTGQSRRGGGVTSSSLARSHISLTQTLIALLLRPDTRHKDRRVDSSGGSLSSLFSDHLSHGSRSLSPRRRHLKHNEDHQFACRDTPAAAGSEPTCAGLRRNGCLCITIRVVHDFSS